MNSPLNIVFILAVMKVDQMTRVESDGGAATFGYMPRIKTAEVLDGSERLVQRAVPGGSAGNWGCAQRIAT